jgi:hypothetical protein
MQSVSYWLIKPTKRSCISTGALYCRQDPSNLFSKHTILDFLLPYWKFHAESFTFVCLLHHMSLPTIGYRQRQDRIIGLFLIFKEKRKIIRNSGKIYQKGLKSNFFATLKY